MDEGGKRFCLVMEPRGRAIMTWPVGLGLLRAPQAPVVEGGIASGSHIPEGTQPSFARAANAELPINSSGLEIRSVIGLPNPRDRFRPAAVTM